MPRPTILDDVRRAEVLALASHGFSHRAIADYVGCAPNTIANTAKRDPAFDQQLRVATQKFVCGNVRLVQQHAARSGRFATWLLERTQPQHFARRSPYSITVAQQARQFRAWTRAMLDAVPPEARQAVEQTALQLSIKLRSDSPGPHDWEDDPADDISSDDAAPLAGRASDGHTNPPNHPPITSPERASDGHINPLVPLAGRASDGHNNPPIEPPIPSPERANHVHTNPPIPTDFPPAPSGENTPSLARPANVHATDVAPGATGVPPVLAGENTSSPARPANVQATSTALLLCAFLLGALTHAWLSLPITAARLASGERAAVRVSSDVGALRAADGMPSANLDTLEIEQEPPDVAALPLKNPRRPIAPPPTANRHVARRQAG